MKTPITYAKYMCKRNLSFPRRQPRYTKCNRSRTKAVRCNANRRDRESLRVDAQGEGKRGFERRRNVTRVDTPDRSSKVRLTVERVEGEKTSEFIIIILTVE